MSGLIFVLQHTRYGVGSVSYHTTLFVSLLQATLVLSKLPNRCIKDKGAVYLISNRLSSRIIHLFLHEANWSCSISAKIYKM